MRFPSFYIFLALLLLNPSISIGAGASGLTGIDSNGYTVAAYCEGGRCSVEMWIESNNESIRDRSWKIFKNEPCKHTSAEDMKHQETRYFSCASSGKSPLAGTKYVSTPYKGSCEDGDPEFEYKCTSGCDGNPRAPRKLLEGHWEC